MIHAGVKAMIDFGTNDMMPHFIYSHYGYLWGYQHLKQIIWGKMRKYGIQSSILTTINMDRVRLITKEKAKQAAEGDLKNDPDWEDYKGSINDDLDSFINNLQNSNETVHKDVWSFSIPKLTNEELKLVKEKNKENMMIYLYGDGAYVRVEEMKKSDSKDKYVKCICQRKTVYLTQEWDNTN